VITAIMYEEVLKRKFASAIWPLGFWLVRQVGGREWSPALARFFGCAPSQTMSQRIWESWQTTIQAYGLRPERFLSSAYRRRFRKDFMKGSRTYACRLRKIVRPPILEQREMLIGEASDGMSGGIQFDSIPTFSELERHFVELAEAIGVNPEKFVPPASQAIADDDMRTKVLASVGGFHGYAECMSGILAELVLASSYTQEGLTLRDASVFLGLDAKGHTQINQKNLPQVLSRLWRRVWGLAQTSPDEARRLVARLCGKILLRETFEHPYSRLPKSHLSMPVGEGRTLGDLIDDGAQQDLERIEEQDAIRVALENLPASEREGCEFLLSGKGPAESGCKKYKTQQRNFQRALKRLQGLRKSTKQIA